MTDLLTDEVNDTGEIRHEPGQTTERLNDYIATGPFPTIRRSDVDLTVETPVYEPETIGVVEDIAVAPTEPTEPPTPVSVAEVLGDDATWRLRVTGARGYVGRRRRRKATRWDGVRATLATAWATVRDAW